MFLKDILITLEQNQVRKNLRAFMLCKFIYADLSLNYPQYIFVKETLYYMLNLRK